MKEAITYIIFATLMFSMGCSNVSRSETHNNDSLSELRDSLQRVADSYPGEIGVAVITDKGDTLTVNNEAKYPMMSVFKLHQAIALCDMLEKTGQSLDSVVSIPRSQLNPDTWSPMLKEHTGDTISLPIRSLQTYTLTLSDNNASNWMFGHLQPVSEADNFIATLIPRESFSLRHTEAEMGLDHTFAYENRTSPLGAAMLINRLYTDSIIGTPDAEFIRTTLDECQTGQDRIVAPLKNEEGIVVGHKTGSGYRSPEGVLAAHNDVGFIRLPNGRHYALAVLVKDFDGSEEDASKVIARISEAVYSKLTK